jgi:tetratricopeptide (TPR) repeat protein
MLASSPLTRPPDSPSSPSGAAHNDADLARLVAAGFALEEARNALDASGGDVQMAVELLFENRGGYAQQHQKKASPTRDEEEIRSPVHDKISFWESKQQPGSEKLASRASAFGATFLKNAKTALDYSKRKISEAVEKAVEAHNHNSSSPAQSSTAGKPPPRDWHNTTSFAPYRDADASNESSTPPSNFTRSSKTPPLPKTESQTSKATTKLDPPSPLLMDLAPPTHSSTTSTTAHFVPPKQRPVNIFDDELPVTSKPHISNPNSVTPQVSAAMPRMPAFSAAPSKPPHTERTKKSAVQATPAQISESAEYKEKGNAQFKAGQYAEAETWYTKAIDCLPHGHSSLAPLYNNRAGARLKTGSYNEAVKDCDRVQDLEPNELKSLLRRASAYEALEKWLDAQSDYRQIMALDSSIKSVSQGLARCTKALKPSKAEESRANGELDFLGNPVAAKVPTQPSSGLQDLQSMSKPANTTSAQVKQAVDAAVQQVRAKHQQAEDEEVMKLALKDQTDDKVGIYPYLNFFAYVKWYVDRSMHGGKGRRKI